MMIFMVQGIRWYDDYYSMIIESIRTTLTKPKFLTSKSYDSNSLELRNASSKENMYEVSFSLHTCISNYIIKIWDFNLKQ